MKRWDQRPFEVRNLFKPAFCGLILFRALQGYEEENSNGMPFSLVLLVLPLCLQRDSRQVIADSPRSYLLKTVENNPQLLVGFANRTTDLMPFRPYAEITEYLIKSSIGAACPGVDAMQ